MNRDNGTRGDIHQSLRQLAVGSYLFQCAVAKELRLGPTDLHAIHLVGRSGTGLTAGELGAALEITSGATTAVITRLTEAGYLTRVRDPDDGRRAILRLTAKAQRDLELRYKPVQARVDKAVADLTAAESAAIARFLRLVTEG